MVRDKTCNLHIITYSVFNKVENSSNIMYNPFVDNT